jgi:predicted nucleic acid-binding protein
MKWFIDTNVFLYIRDTSEPAKGAMCEAWLKRLQSHGQIIISPQVINEVFSNLLKAATSEVERATAETFSQGLLPWCDAKLDREVVSSAFALRRRYQLSWWDSILIQSAITAGADRLLTEDLNDGQVYGRLQAINPFRHSPEDVLGRAI